MQFRPFKTWYACRKSDSYYFSKVREIDERGEVFGYFFTLSLMSVFSKGSDASHAKLVDLVSWLTNKIDKVTIYGLNDVWIKYCHE